MAVFWKRSPQKAPNSGDDVEKPVLVTLMYRNVLFPQFKEARHLTRK